MCYGTISTYTTMISLIINCSDTLVFLDRTTPYTAFFGTIHMRCKTGRMLHIPATDEWLDLGAVHISYELYHRMYNRVLFCMNEMHATPFIPVL
jgi:hypothetical protein